MKQATINTSSGLLDGTPEEIERRCADYLAKHGWELLDIDVSAGCHVDFTAKTKAFGEDHRLNQKGYFFAWMTDYGEMRRYFVHAKLEALMGKWKADGFGIVYFSTPYAHAYMEFQDLDTGNCLEIKAKLSDEILQEPGYGFLTEALSQYIIENKLEDHALLDGWREFMGSKKEIRADSPGRKEDER